MFRHSTFTPKTLTDMHRPSQALLDPSWLYDLSQKGGEVGRQEGGDEAEKVPVVETPVFILYTKDSALKKRLQETDRMLGEATNSPTVRFVERCGGGTLIGFIGDSIP